MRKIAILVLTVMLLPLTACQPAAPKDTAAAGLRVVAAESFLADIVKNVAGDRAQVTSLIPLDMDPHSFEMTPQDIAGLSKADVIVINGGGLEAWLDKTLAAGRTNQPIITASDGLKTRTPDPGEPVDQTDPHFWMDPTLVIQYVKNIRDGLSKVDPAGKSIYEQNTAAYIVRLNELDAWITSQVDQISPEKRLLVTNHETFGYYADRYGFKITGTIIPGVSTEASPSARQMAALIDQIRSTHTPAIFLETGVNPDLAAQISKETGVKVVIDLYTHSITSAGGPAPTYIDMLRYDTKIIVDSLK